MITPIDTRARWIERLASVYEASAIAWRAIDGTWRLRAFIALAEALDVSEAKLRRWLDASPDLRAALVAKGWPPNG